jgi:hypothetical protein
MNEQILSSLLAIQRFTVHGSSHHNLELTHHSHTADKQVWTVANWRGVGLIRNSVRFPLGIGIKYNV